MALRCQDPGWKPIDVPDERRGLWVRRSPGYLELCAGREGDDAYVFLREGQDLTQGDLDSLYDVLETYRYAVELEQEEDKP